MAAIVTADALLALVAMLGDDVKQEFAAALVGETPEQNAGGRKTRTTSRATSKASKTGKTSKTGRAASTPAAAQKAGTTHKTVALTTAAKQVAGGADPWKVWVKSSNTGLPIPYGKVLRAIRAQERAEARAAEAADGVKAGKTRKGTKASTAGKARTAGKASANPYFSMSKADLLADGSKGAKAELARRKAKRASK